MNLIPVFVIDKSKIGSRRRSDLFRRYRVNDGTRTEMLGVLIFMRHCAKPLYTFITTIALRCETTAEVLGQEIN